MVTEASDARILVWDGCVNVRDLGGIPTEDGGQTQFGHVIRSDNIGALTPEGWRALDHHDVARIVDLRFPEERAQDPPRNSGVEVVHVSVLGPSFAEGMEYLHTLDDHVDLVDDVADHFAYSYVEFLERNAPRFAEALAAIADADGPVVIHCMGGKDRTGLVAALVLRIAGVSLDEIGLDYARSESNLAATLASWLAEAPTAADRRRREKLSHTPAHAMVRVIGEIEHRHGSVAGYLEGAGLRTDQLDRLRERLR